MSFLSERASLNASVACLVCRCLFVSVGFSIVVRHLKGTMYLVSFWPRQAAPQIAPSLTHRAAPFRYLIDVPRRVISPFSSAASFPQRLLGQFVLPFARSHFSNHTFCGRRRCALMQRLSTVLPELQFTSALKPFYRVVCFSPFTCLGPLFLLIKRSFLNLYALFVLRHARFQFSGSSFHA